MTGFLKFIKQYVFNCLIVADSAVNVALLFGSPDDTISGRAERGRADGYRVWTWLADFLDFLQRNHCEMALANDTTGADRHTEALDLE